MPASPTVNTTRSFIRFTYPVTFDASMFGERIDAVQAATWPNSKREVPVWESAPFIADDMVDHVARYLNPTPDQSPSAGRWRLANDARQSAAGFGRSSWDLIWKARRNQHEVIPITFDDIEITLFNTGVGLLTICVSTPNDNLTSWIDLLHTFRFARGQRDVFVGAESRVFDQATRTSSNEPFFPAFAGGEAALDEHGHGTIGQVIDGLLATAAIPGDYGAPWWREVFVPGQLVPFTGLFVNELEGDDLHRLVYRVHNALGSRQEIFPTDADLDLATHPGALPYVRNGWFTFSLDGGGFVAGDLPDTPFFRDQLPEHLRTRYFLAYLVVLHQRFTLMKLSSDAATCWQLGRESTHTTAQEQAIDRIRDTFLMFTARGYFAQVMQQEHHHEVYKRWQSVLQVERLYREVHDEVREMSQYILEQRTQRIAELQAEATRQRELEHERHRQRDAWLGIVTGVLAGPALTLSFLGVTGPVSTGTAAFWTIASAAIGALLLWLLVTWIQRRII